MKPRKRYVLVIGIACCMVAFGTAAWGVVRLATWAKDLPNRIIVDLDDFPIESIVTESTRIALMSEDQRQQVECLEYLVEGSRTNPEVIPWIQSEFAAELSPLRDSPDERIASLARALHEAASSNGTTQ